MTYFVGILEGAKKSWGVRFPDIDGCVGAGTTPEAAVADAAQALRDVTGYKRQVGAELPRPRPLAEILQSGEVGPRETTVFVPLLLDAGRSVRANVSFDAGLLDAIDAAATRRGVTRSAFLASAAREKIQAQG